MPRPVAAVVVGCIQVDVAVAQLAEHVAEHLEQLLVVHAVVHADLIFLIDGVPVKPVLVLLVVEEAVVLVDNLPQRLEVTLRRVVELLLVDAAGDAGGEA